MAIANRNLAEASLTETFERDTLNVLRLLCPEDKLDEVTCLDLVRDSLHAIFREQGLEFADMILQGAGQRTVLQKSLPDVIAYVVERAGVSGIANGAVRNALLLTIREMVYSGTTAQRMYLDRLSRTYMMLFLLQCDPKVVAYFGSMATKLNIYVGTSVLIPALSEQFLDKSHRRYTNLLLRASKAGVKLRYNEPILQELAAHFRLIDQVYREQYQSCEAVYLAGDSTRYVDRIMLRAYFHARGRGQVNNFRAFLECFVSPDFRTLNEDLVSFLDSALGVQYDPNSSRGIRLNPDQVKDLTTALVKHKLIEEKARTDAKVLLTVHAVREMNNEIGTGGLAGYRTWWLTSDISTQRAAHTVSSLKHSADCYMRPDFLYNFVSLAPLKGEADDAFRSLLPSLLGVNISFHLPDGAAEVIHSFVAEHQQKDPARARAVVRELSDRVKHDDSLLVREHLVPFLEQRGR